MGLGQTFSVERDMPAAAQKARDALFGLTTSFSGRRGEGPARHGLPLSRESTIVTDVNMRPTMKAGRGLHHRRKPRAAGHGHFAVPARDVNEALLEEFAKILLGEPGGFRKYRSVFARRPT